MNVALLVVAVAWPIPLIIFVIAAHLDGKTKTIYYQGQMKTLRKQRDALIKLYVPQDVQNVYKEYLSQNVDTESISREAVELAAITSNEERRNILKKRLGLK